MFDDKATGIWRVSSPHRTLCSPTPERMGRLKKKRARGQRNPLKRLNSDKEIKENPKAFLWLFMDFLGRTGVESPELPQP